MLFRLLGPVEVCDHVGSPLPVAPRERVVLTALLLEAGKVVSQSRLIHAIWETNPPPTARDQVYARISRLRRLLRDAGTAEIATTGSGYRVTVDADTLDLLVFRRLLDQARAASAQRCWAEAIRAYRSGEQLWRGPALESTGGGALRSAAAALDEQRLCALEDRLDLELRHDPKGNLVAELTGLVGQYPYHERLHTTLMQALYQVGRKADALAVYDRVRVRLADELGVDPSPELRELHQSILRDQITVPPLPMPDLGRYPTPTLDPVVGTGSGVLVR